MADLLVIVPSKGRPRNIPRLLDAIEATAGEPVDVLIVVDEGEFAAYTPADSRSTVWGCPGESTYPQKLNLGALWARGRGYRYLALWNDDHVPETPGWDVTMKTALADDPFGMAYANDGIWEAGQVPTAPIVTASMFDALGWVAAPWLHHILVDNVWLELADACGTTHWFPDLMIRHLHYTNGLAVLDDTYRQTSDGDKANQDAERWEAWHQNGKADDVARLRALWS